MITNIRNNESTIDECVDHIPGLFVDLNPMEIRRCPGHPDSERFPGKSSDPPEFGLEFVDN